MAGEGSIGVERSVQLRMNGGRCFAGAEISEGSTNAHAVVNEGAEGRPAKQKSMIRIEERRKIALYA